MAYYGGITVKIGDGAGTEVFTALENVISLSGLGVTNNLIDVTSFDSNGVMEYIPGLADGETITIECNEVLDATTQLALITDVAAGTQSRNIEIEATDGTNTTTYSMATVPMSYSINPSVSDKNTISFSLKISGAITAA